MGNIRLTGLSICRKIEKFFYRSKGRNFLIFLFFLTMSFTFWVLVSLQEEYEIQTTIPILYKNVPPDIAFARDLPTELTVRIRDKGTILLNYSFKGKNITPITIDLKGLSAGKGIFTYPTHELEALLMKRLSATTNLLNFSPQLIEEAYSKLENKKIPVSFYGSVRTEPGFQLAGDITINPAYVDAYASDLVLDTLRSVQTVYTEIRRGKGSIEENVMLEKPQGVTINPTTVLIHIPIEEFTEKTLDIPIVYRGVPQNYTMRMFPAMARVRCSVPLSRFKDLTEREFEVEVSLDDPDKHVSGMLPVALKKSPDWVSDVSFSPNSIEFILEQKSIDD